MVLLQSGTSMVFLIPPCLLSLALPAPFGADVSGQTLAFPGAEGYGKFTTGGRGGRVLEVTNLNDRGPGSLREALTAKGPRTVVFRLSGTIALASDLVVTHGDLTVAGQTAPGDGICIRNYPTVVSADNVTLRYLRFRPGDTQRTENDALTVIGQKNVIIDHCSMSWAIDEVGSFYDNTNFTLQWCILSESLNSSFHRKGEHGYGGIWGGSSASFHHNLLAHHTSRNPRFNGGRTRPDPGTERVDFRNNVVYNWGSRCMYGGEMGKQNIVANYFKPGPASKHRGRFLELDDDSGQWYVAENVVEGQPHVSADNWAGVVAKAGTSGRQDEPFPCVAHGTEEPAKAFAAVLEHAGAVLPRRDPVDRRVVAEAAAGETASGTGIIDSQDEVGGWPLLRSCSPPDDTDHDGIPDDWERRKGLLPHNPDDGRAITGTGYTNLEMYLNQIIR
jgi:hypothetical protein